MKLAIHFPNHEWFSAALCEKVEINFRYCDLKSGPIWINDSWGKKYDLHFGAGHLHDEWEDVEFGPEVDPTQELDKFFGQEVPIYVSGSVGDGYPGHECGDKIPGFDSHCLDSMTFKFNSEEEFWNIVEQFVDNILAEIMSKEK